MSDDPIKEALNMIPYGFYAITSNDGDGEVNIMVANWLSQVSFTPRLVMLGLSKKALSHEVIAKGRVFAVNIFNKADDEIIRSFTKSREKNPDKVKDASYSLSETVHCPVITGAAAYLEVRVIQMVDTGGDHDVVIGEVVGAGVSKPGKPGESLTLPDLEWSYAG